LGDFRQKVRNTEWLKTMRNISIFRWIGLISARIYGLPSWKANPPSFHWIITGRFGGKWLRIPDRGAALQTGSFTIGFQTVISLQLWFTGLIHSSLRWSKKGKPFGRMTEMNSTPI